ncbi:MAG: hypothetical protein HUU10_12540 [Bacteroidetes bacterium]|nr:hypothetical protein [Bacteroidota bacterium]
MKVYPDEVGEGTRFFQSLVIRKYRGLGIGDRKTRTPSDLTEGKILSRGQGFFQLRVTNDEKIPVIHDWKTLRPSLSGGEGDILSSVF